MGREGRSTPAAAGQQRQFVRGRMRRWRRRGVSSTCLDAPEEVSATGLDSKTCSSELPRCRQKQGRKEPLGGGYTLGAELCMLRQL